MFVLGVSMIKEAREDYKRHKADNEVNNRGIDVLDAESGEFQRRKWQDVQVGDIIMVKKNHFFPADLLFLTAENEEGTCYVETMNLDGETNLKIKKALDETKDLTHATLKGFRGGVECEPPNSRLYQFTGNLLLAPPLVPEERTIPVNPAAILLRGCALRNTEHVFGAVIYAGARVRHGILGCAQAGGTGRSRGRQEQARCCGKMSRRREGGRSLRDGVASTAGVGCRAVVGRGSSLRSNAAAAPCRAGGRGTGRRRHCPSTLVAQCVRERPTPARPSPDCARRPREQDLQERHGGALQAQPRGAHH